MLEELVKSKWVGYRVASITLDPIQHHLGLLRRQEPVPVREVGYEKPCCEAEDDCEDTLDDEDPLPPVQATFASEELECVCEDSAKPAEDDGDEVESGQAFLDFVSFVPRCDDKCESGEEAGLIDNEKEKG